MTSKNTKSVDCPGCQKQVAWTEANEFRPFCSKRCQLIDFGDWATEKHSIQGEPFYPVDEDDTESLQ